MASWLGVVSRDHVRRGVRLGIAQINHGRRSALARMRAGDLLIYYSPRTSLQDGTRLQAFTAFGELVDDELWQVDEGTFRPWRRRVAYEPDVTDAPLADLRSSLELTSSPDWGVSLRRGLVEISEHDRALIVGAMRAGDHDTIGAHESA